MNYLVIIIGIVILSTTLLGYKRGFFKSAFAVIAMLLAMVLTYYFTPHIASWLAHNTQIDNVVNENLEQTLNETVFGEKGLKSRKAQKKALKESGMPEILQQILVDNNNKEFYKALGATKFTEYVAGYLTGIVMNLLSYLITYLIVWIILRIVISILNEITKLPILNGLNHIGGALFGFSKGMIYLLLFFLVISLLGNTEIGKSAMQMIQENNLLLWLYENNPVLKVITDVTRQIF